MIKNQINLYGSINPLRMKCYACGKPDHLVANCHLLHFIPDKEKVIKKFEYSHLQERMNFERKKKKKIKYKIFKPSKEIDQLANKLKLMESDSYYEEEEESEIVSNDINDSNLTNSEKKNSKILENIPEKNKSKLTETKNSFIAENPIEQQLQVFSYVPKKNDENNKRYSAATGNEHRASLQKVNFEVESQETNLKKGILNPDNEENTLWKLWQFDKVHNFSKYYPMYNCQEILRVYNKSHSPTHLNVQRRKTKILRRYSEYTLFPIQMYEKIKNKKKSKKDLKRGVSENRPRIVDTLFNLITLLKNKKAINTKSRFDSITSRFKTFIKHSKDDPKIKNKY